MKINYFSIRATLGFAKTIHKSQSLTEDFIIMNVNQRPRGIFAMTFRMFFVAYTRVRSDNNLRIFKPSNSNFNHLMKYRHDPKFIHWLAGFTEGKCWCVAAAKASFESMIKKPKYKPKPTADGRGKPHGNKKRSNIDLKKNVSESKTLALKQAVQNKSNKGKIPDLEIELQLFNQQQSLEVDNNHNKAAEANTLNQQNNSKQKEKSSPHFPRTLINFGKTCFANAPLQIFASIPEAVSAVKFFKENANIHYQSLHKLMPAIATPTVLPHHPIDETLNKVLTQFIEMSSKVTNKDWKLGTLHDAAEIINVILDSVPEINELFSFSIQETLTCTSCQKDSVVEIVPCNEIIFLKHHTMIPSMSQEIISQFNINSITANGQCPNCNLENFRFKRKKIITAPPKYLLITIKSSEDNNPISLPPCEQLDLKELFAASNPDSAIFELHAAIIFRKKHFTTYLHNSKIYIDDAQSMVSQNVDNTAVHIYAQTLYYCLQAPNDAAFHDDPDQNNDMKDDEEPIIRMDLDEKQAVTIDLSNNNAGDAASKKSTEKSKENKFPRTLPNFHNTCYANAALQVIASIPEAVEAIKNYKFHVNDKTSIGWLLQQFVPAIADHTANRNNEIQPELRNLLENFVTSSSKIYDNKWNLGNMFDPADLIKVILIHFPDISHLFSFQLKQTRSCTCQATNPNNNIYIYEETLLPIPDESETTAENEFRSQEITQAEILDFNNNQIETRRRLANRICMFCIPGIHAKDGADFPLAISCQHHNVHAMKTEKASYYPAPKKYLLMISW